jgi:histidinol phosphatase-like PHP family hydrolase
VGVEGVNLFYVTDHTNSQKKNTNHKFSNQHKHIMSLKKEPTPLEKVGIEIDNWIKKTDDEISKYPLHAAKEIIQSNLEYEKKFAGKMYDYGASGRWGYETGYKFFIDKLK